MTSTNQPQRNQLLDGARTATVNLSAINSDTQKQTTLTNLLTYWQQERAYVTVQLAGLIFPNTIKLGDAVIFDYNSITNEDCMTISPNTNHPRSLIRPTTADTSGSFPLCFIDDLTPFRLDSRFLITGKKDNLQNKYTTLTLEGGR